MLDREELVDALREAVVDPTAEQSKRLAKDSQVGRYARMVGTAHAMLGGEWTLAGAEQQGSDVRFAVSTPRGTPYSVRFELGPGQRPHVVGFGVERKFPPGISVRHAIAADQSAITALTARVPIAEADSEVFVEVDEGGDLAPLAGQVYGAVGEVNGEIVAHTSAVVMPTVDGSGRRGSVLYRRHLRVDPAHQGTGLGRGCVLAFLGQAEEDTLGGVAIVAVDNKAAQEFGPERKNQPDSRSLRFLLPATNGRPSEEGRVATQADAARLADLMNMAHAEEGLWPGADAGVVRARLESMPQVYSWSSIRMGDRAFVGVAHVRERRRRRAADGSVHKDVRSRVLDWGCEPGAESELAELVASAAASCPVSTTLLAALVPSRSPAIEAFAAAATNVEAFDVIPLGGLLVGGTRGVFVDPAAI